MSTLTKPNHIGRKISRIRELKDMKQEALAQALGTNQQAVSIMENSETIEEEKLIEVAKALGVSPEAIKNFSEESVFNYFNSFYDNDITGGIVNAPHSNHCSFNPLDKMMEVVDENRKLYERLLQAEKDKVEYLEKLLKTK
jgi:transcriptional regulator with XRE-family HTH domain